MRVVVDRSLFEPSSDREAMLLWGLLTAVAEDGEEGYHALVTDPPYERGEDNAEIDRWLDARPLSEKRALLQVLEQGVLSDRTRPRAARLADTRAPRRWNLAGCTTIRVQRQSESDWRGRCLTMADAVDLLREPTHLALENARTDQAFVRLVAGPLGPRLSDRFRAAGKVQLHGGGSGESKKWIEGALLRDTDVRTRWRRMLRTWVLFDKDAGNHDANELSDTAQEIVHLCEEVVSDLGEGLSWICLLRREIESYTPDRGLLEEATQHQRPFAEKVVALRRSPDEGLAWALDLKKGLRGDLRADLLAQERRDLKAQQIALQAHMLKPPFSAFDATQVQALDLGFGERLGTALQADPPRSWAPDLPFEYDRGPRDQVGRHAFVQSLFDRM